MDRVFSGLQPTGALHIGNYLGALQTWVDLAGRHEAYFAVVDYHAITTSPPPAPEALRRRVRDTAAGFLVAGLDPDRATIFVQSEVPEHTELAWILGCLTPMGDLGRMTQFKEKSAEQQGIEGLGLFAYPVLQAADILLYRATLVPVGEDQLQHLELARELARRFNRTYGETFPEPRAALSPAPRVLGLDGRQKMSKSRGNEIGLTEPAEAVRAKLATAMTDPARRRRSDPGDPEKCNVFTLHTFFTPAPEREECARGCRTAAIGCLDCKAVLAERLNAFLEPFRERAASLEREPGRIETVLARGAEQARRLARETMEAVRSRIGVR